MRTIAARRLLDNANGVTRVKNQQPAVPPVHHATPCPLVQTVPARHVQTDQSRTLLGQRVWAALLSSPVRADSALGAVLGRSPALTARRARHAHQDTPALVARVLCVHQAKSPTTARPCVQAVPMALLDPTARALHALEAPSQTPTKQRVSRVRLGGPVMQGCAASVPRGRSLRKDDWRAKRVL